MEWNRTTLSLNSSGVLTGRATAGYRVPVVTTLCPVRFFVLLTGPINVGLCYNLGAIVSFYMRQ